MREKINELSVKKEILFDYAEGMGVNFF